MTVRHLVAGLLLGAFAPLSLAAGGGALLDYAPDVSNSASVQRGAANFMNYCSGWSGSHVCIVYLRRGQDTAEPAKFLLIFCTCVYM